MYLWCLNSFPDTHNDKCYSEIMVIFTETIFNICPTAVMIYGPFNFNLVLYKV